MTLRDFGFAVCLLLLGSAGALAGPVRINQVQVIGTHNSYHLAPWPTLIRLVAATSPWVAQSFRYSHRPLAEQFSLLGIRQIELDLFPDPEGGLYENPLGNRAARRRGLSTGPPRDPLGRLRQPGIKILHEQDFDFRSTVLTLREALEQVRAWSHAHPFHFPILVLLDLKTASLGEDRTLAFGREQLDGLDQEIRAIFRGEELLQPDDIRQGLATLPAALARYGWPPLDRVRGHVFFALSNGAPIRDLYLEGHPALQGRVLFVNVPETHPAAAWMKLDDPIHAFSTIQHLVRSGFLVRTRADANTFEALAHDRLRREKALESGAQFVSTDFPEPVRNWSDYAVRFPEGVVVRTNPVNGDPELRGRELEEPPAAPASHPRRQH